MRLKVQLRRAGDVAVLVCEGPIVSGAEAEHLEQRIVSELDDGTRRLVLEVGAVTRLDSSGLGLMVRLLMCARKAGGDLAIACPPAFVVSLLEMTRLSKLFHVFPSEHEAVASYRRTAPELAKPASPHARVIFLDQSADLGALVRTVLTVHGYEVLSATLVREVKIHLQVGKTDIVLIGPNRPQIGFEGPSLTAFLTKLAPAAAVIELDRQFQTLEAEQASAILLQLMGEKKKASSSGTA